MPNLRLAALAALSVVLLHSTLVSAGTTYRWIDPKSGTTVISDQPPPPGAKQIVKRGGEEAVASEPQPYATRQAVAKFPVTLYTSADCADECKAARALLNARGVPFSENMLNTREAIAELSKLLGSEAGVPSLRVGQQSFKGLEPGAWHNLLDLAGYPKSAPYGAKPSGAFAK
jgi:glutaredoxin